VYAILRGLKMFGDLHDLVVFLLVAIGIFLTIKNEELRIRNSILNDECNELALKKHNADMELSRYKRNVAAVISNYCESIKKNHGAIT
jgi:hypothetical protein